MKVKELIDALKTFDENENVRLYVHGTLKDASWSLSLGSIDIEDVSESSDCDDVDFKQVDIQGDFGEI